MSRAVLATVHLGALRRNFARARERAGGARVMAMVKADGYGHGLERVARALPMADAFGVASFDEAARLRAAGIAQRILVMAGPDAPEDLAAFRDLEIDAAIHHPEQLQWLTADADPRLLRVWLKLDTGMHRLGFAPEEAMAAREALRYLPNIDGEIVPMTHFASADIPGDTTTAAQIAAFGAATAGMPGPRSLANSAGLLGWPAARGAQAWVRVGGLLYGLSTIEGRSGADLGFEPAMSLAAKLISIRTRRRGARIGYAATWECPQDMRVGVAAIGYGDGYPRGARSGTPVLVGGARARLVGRVSMDLVTLDLRAAPQAQIGDEVILWGRGLPAEEVAACAGTISYDLTCGLTGRVRFVADGN